MSAEHRASSEPLGETDTREIAEPLVVDPLGDLEAQRDGLWREFIDFDPSVFDREATRLAVGMSIVADIADTQEKIAEIKRETP